MSNPKSTSKWKRFSGASYAPFQSLHREVQIGVLAVAMLPVVGLKAHAMHNPDASASQPLGSLAEESLADSTIVGLENVDVLATRVPLTQAEAPRLVTVLSAVDIAAAAVHSINDLLEYAVGVDVRQRGELGVQTDISVRGGNFDQITLLLNGVNISSPHTGHLSADFPVAMHDIERIEILEGPSARVFGTSAFTGVINIVTRQEGSSLALTGGSYGYAGGDLALSYKGQVGRSSHSHRLSGGYSRSDGATPHSAFSNTHFFYRGHFASPNNRFRLDAQAGYSYKPYDANTFYGASNDQQWESNERLLGSLRAEADLGRWHLAPTLYWNRWYDHYQWWKDVSPAGENFHKVDSWGGAFNAWVEHPWGKTSMGVEARQEGIYSTNLGRELDESHWVSIGGQDHNPERSYTHHDCRTNISAFLEHNIVLSQWTLSMGLLANRNTGLDHRWRLYPGIDVSYRPSAYWKVVASWNTALRMPTFTDLYYSGKNIEGNSHLRPERTSDLTLGARYRRPVWRGEVSLFYSHKRDMIDWVTLADETSGVFHSVNFKADHWGGSLALDWLPQEVWAQQPLRKLGIQYAYIDEHSSYPQAITASKYAMDYLRHKVVIQAEGQLYKHLCLALAWRWQDRVGEVNLPYALLDARLAWNASRWSVYAECSNLLDKNYFDYISIPQPGRWAKVGIEVKF